MKMVSEKILDLRRKNRLSQEELADAIGVSRQTISKWETGNVFPDIENLLALSDYFKVDITYFVDNEICATVSKEQIAISGSENKIIKEIMVSQKTFKRIKILLISLSFIAVFFVMISIYSGLIVFSVPNNSSVETIYFSDLNLNIFDVFLVSVIISTLMLVCIFVISIITAKHKKKINLKENNKC